MTYTFRVFLFVLLGLPLLVVLLLLWIPTLGVTEPLIKYIWKFDITRLR